MIKLIISILVAILVYISLGEPKDIRENLTAADPTKPEKCFYDPELVANHSAFVNSLKSNPEILKKIKQKILPLVCILDLVINQKRGWDKYLDGIAKKYNTDKKGALIKYMQENYDKIVDYANANGLSFLTEPYKVDIDIIDATTGDKKTESKEVNILKEFQDTILKKINESTVF
jgi:hypothetical protein